MTKTKKTNNNSLTNTNDKINDIDQLKDLITEPIDYGDYFSIFNDIEEEKNKSEEEIIIVEPEPDDFYFKSCLTGFNLDKNGKKENKNENINVNADNENEKNKSRYNRSNTTIDIRKYKIPDYYKLISIK